jgi:hypothetical protein
MRTDEKANSRSGYVSLADEEAVKQVLVNAALGLRCSLADGSVPARVELEG